MKNSVTLFESLKTLVIRPPVCLLVKKLSESLLIAENTSVLMSFTVDVATRAIRAICTILVISSIILLPIIISASSPSASVNLPASPKVARYSLSFSSIWSKSTLPVKYGHTTLIAAPSA